VYCVIHIPLCACSCTVSYTFLADKMGLVEECLCLSVCLSVCLCTYIYTHIELANMMGLVEEFFERSDTARELA